MKVAVVVGLVFAVSLHQSDTRSIGINDDLSKIMQEITEQACICAKKMGVKALLIPPVYINDKRPQELPEDNEALNELYGCIWVKRGILNETGDFNTDKFETFLLDVLASKEKVSELIRSRTHEVAKACKNVHGENYGQTAVKHLNCVLRYTKNKIQE